MKKQLTSKNIEFELAQYRQQMRSIQLFANDGNILRYLWDLKHRPLGSGPYLKVSLFETANRVFSDLVILLGIRQLLCDRHVGGIALPFECYDAALGTTHGLDITAEQGTKKLVGEAFHVAQSFFPTKMGSVREKLETSRADFKLVLFNSDAPKKLIKPGRQDNGLIYVPVEKSKYMEL
ncbi:MAG: hypothetical protein EXR47_07130 [Dehalococcoidia bacterium]|nr:hypothetical protein [Dehalococcoidia bacterium]